jgi:hypothetical protein
MATTPQPQLTEPTRLQDLPQLIADSNDGKKNPALGRVILELERWLWIVYLILRRIKTKSEAQPEVILGRSEWGVGAFFNGAITVGQPAPRFVVPEGISSFFVTHLRITFQAGTPSGDTEVEVGLLSGGAVTLLGTLILASTDDPDVVYSVFLVAPVQLKAGDVIKWECTATGDHEEVTAGVCGRQAI